MSDSKIEVNVGSRSASLVEVLESFKQLYAWDKSLINPDVAFILPTPDGPDEHSATYLEDFIRSQQATAQTDSGGY